MGERENGVRIISSPPVQGRDPVRDGKLSLESLVNGAPLPTRHSVSTSVVEPAAPILSDQCPIRRTGLSQPNVSGPFPLLSLACSGMLAIDKGPLVIPFVWAGFGVVDERVVSIVMVGYDTSPWGKGATALVG
jgi:hypothetical protein